jgi:hypothetical protein
MLRQLRPSGAVTVPNGHTASRWDRTNSPDRSARWRTGSPLRVLQGFGRQVGISLHEPAPSGGVVAVPGVVQPGRVPVIRRELLGSLRRRLPLLSVRIILRREIRQKCPSPSSVFRGLRPAPGPQPHASQEDHQYRPNKRWYELGGSSETRSIRDRPPSKTTSMRAEVSG